MRIMTPIEGAELLKGLIRRNAPHNNQRPAVEMADFWEKIVSGKEQDELVVSYKMRESDEQKQQRIHITNTPTPEAVNRALTNLDRLDNPDGLIREISYSTEDATKTTALLDRVITFNGDRNLDSYIDDNFKRFNTIDANAFLVVTFFGQRDASGKAFVEKPRPKPENVPSSEVYDYERENGAYNWLCRKQHFAKKVDTGGRIETVEYCLYTLYWTDYALEALQITKASPVSKLDEKRLQYEQVQIAVSNKMLDYALIIYPLQSGEVPFINWGFQADTKEEMYLPIMAPVESRVRDLINRNSEYALTMALHTFLQKYQYTRACQNTVHRHGQCQGGKFSISGDTCGLCKGTGKEIITTVQDTITVALPDNKDEFFPLSELVRYVEMPFQIVEHLKAELKEIPMEIERTLWGVNEYEAQSNGGNVTATEILTRYDTAYARLSKMGDHKARIWLKCLRLTAKYAEIEAGLQAKYQYPNTFALETLLELMAMLKHAKDSGAPPPAIAAIEQQILKRQGQITAVEIKWYNAMDSFRPFKSKSAEDVAGIIAGLPYTSYYNILWTYFDEIFEEIRIETPDFANMPRNGAGMGNQTAVIKKKVEDFKVQIEADAPIVETSADLFNRIPSDINAN